MCHLSGDHCSLFSTEVYVILGIKKEKDEEEKKSDEIKKEKDDEDNESSDEVKKEDIKKEVMLLSSQRVNTVITLHEEQTSARFKLSTFRSCICCCCIRNMYVDDVLFDMNVALIGNRNKNRRT